MILFTYIKEVYIRMFFLIVGFCCIFCSFFIYREEYFYKFGGVIWYLVEGKFIYTGFGEVFLGYLWFSLILSFLILFWLFLLNIYLFMLPGFLLKEAKSWLSRLTLSFIFLIIGFFILHFYFLKYFCIYLMGYSVIEGIGGLSIEFEPRFGEFINFLIRIDLLFFLFLLSLIFLFGYLYGNKSRLGFVRYNCYILALLIIVLVVPPDFILHLIIYIFVIMGLEFIFFIICCKESYKEFLKKF